MDIDKSIIHEDFEFRGLGLESQTEHRLFKVGV